MRNKSRGRKSRNSRKRSGKTKTVKVTTSRGGIRL